MNEWHGGVPQKDVVTFDPGVRDYSSFLIVSVNPVTDEKDVAGNHLSITIHNRHLLLSRRAAEHEARRIEQEAKQKAESKGFHWITSLPGIRRDDKRTI